MSDRSGSLRALPAVDRLADAVLAGDPAVTHAEATAAARAVLAERRVRLLAGERDDADLVALARAHLTPPLRRVLNGTGVIVHTNLGRAPLSADARDAVRAASSGYANVELDLG
ncbi:MAG TPA: hypothetical protein VFV85_03190, partial [Conexibacter sp.]|nr:hypothetical protein [Conexibacter sp.]